MLLLLSALAFASDSQPDAPPAPEPSEAQSPPPVEVDRSKGFGRSWLLLPGVFYSQETGLGFALYGSATFPIRGTGPGTWPSTVAAAAVVTLKKQWSLAVWPRLYFGTDNAWVLNGSYIVSHFPTRYYGLGPATDPVFQDYTRRWVLTETSLMRRVHGDLYLGIADDLSLTGVRDPSAPVEGNKKDPAVWTGDDELGIDPVPGDVGGLVHGLGVRMRHERRDNDQSTRRGTYVDLRFTAYPTWLGSDYSYLQGIADLRAFATVGGAWTFAGQWLTEVRHGDVPFTHMAELGGDNMLRGMFEGRYRDKSMTALQGELRFPIYWRFRGVAFAGAGQVFSSASELVAAPPHWTAGGGLRFELDDESHNTLRLDVAGGPDGMGFIFNFGEAF